MKRIVAAGAAAALATVGFAGTAAAAPPDGAGKGGKPFGIECQQAGIAKLQGADLLNGVAKDGLDATFALTPGPDGLGVTVRPGADPSGVPDPIPFSVLLADHRAGDNSIFVYPWCEAL